MSNLAQSSKTIHFGRFEADLHAGTLRKHGIRIRLQDKPFQILSLLLHRAGEVVARQDILQKLWTEGTQGDLNHSLNVAIAKLRNTLSDSAERPRFIETVGSRGYRFIAPVGLTVITDTETPHAAKATVHPIRNSMMDNRDLLNVLKGELEFVRTDGYHRPNWRANFVFEDSPACPNSKMPGRLVRCADCALIELVPSESREEKIPCRHIPLTDAGETIEYFYRYGHQEELDQALTGWLRTTIHRLEENGSQKVT